MINSLKNLVASRFQNKKEFHNKNKNILKTIIGLMKSLD